MNNLLVWCVKKWLHLSPDLVSSELYDETTFYQQFRDDLRHCNKEVIIESPFISTHRMYSLIQPFQGLVNRKVKVYVITRDPSDHDLGMKQQAEEAIRTFEAMGVQVLITNDYSHRKLAILDRTVLWEGSLNILSQNMSRELMRRIDSKNHAQECFRFINLGKFIY